MTIAGIDQLAVDFAAKRGARQARSRWRAATSATVTGCGKALTEPSGSRMSGMATSSCQKKSAVEPHFFAHHGWVQRVGSRVSLVLVREPMFRLLLPIYLLLLGFHLLRIGW